MWKCNELPRQKGQVLFDFLSVEEKCGLSPRFLIRHFYKLTEVLWKAQRKGYAALREQIGTSRKANKWLLMCLVSQTEKQMPSAHKSTQLLQASVDSYLYRN